MSSSSLNALFDSSFARFATRVLVVLMVAALAGCAGTMRGSSSASSAPKAAPAPIADVAPPPRPQTAPPTRTEMPPPSPAEEVLPPRSEAAPLAEREAPSLPSDNSADSAPVTMDDTPVEEPAAVAETPAESAPDESTQAESTPDESTQAESTPTESTPAETASESTEAPMETPQSASQDEPPPSMPTERTAVAEPVQAQPDTNTVAGTVDAPSGDVRITEEEKRPQALAGTLPMAIGLDEQGEFDFDQAVLRPEVRSLLDSLAEKLRSAEFDRLDITGHTDRIGTPEYNQHLSDRRAWAVARYLMRKGVPLQKMRVVGLGERNPLTAAEQCRSLTHAEMIRCLQKDRRVEIDASVRSSHVEIDDNGMTAQRAR